MNASDYSLLILAIGSSVVSVIGALHCIKYCSSVCCEFTTQDVDIDTQNQEQPQGGNILTNTPVTRRKLTKFRKMLNSFKIGVNTNTTLNNTARPVAYMPNNDQATSSRHPVSPV